MHAAQTLTRITGRPAPQFDYTDTNAERHARIAAEVATEVAALQAELEALEAAARGARP
jgi:hypothetical protein